MHCAAWTTNNNHKAGPTKSLQTALFLCLLNSSFKLLHRSQQDSHISSSSFDAIVCCCFMTTFRALQFNFHQWNYSIGFIWFDRLALKRLATDRFHLTYYHLKSIDSISMHQRRRSHNSRAVRAFFRRTPRTICYSENMCACGRTFAFLRLKSRVWRFFHMIRCHASYVVAALCICGTHRQCKCVEKPNQNN